MAKNRIKIRVLNAIGGTYTSVEHAIKWLQEGRARLRPDVDDFTVEIVPEHERNVAALQAYQRSLERSEGTRAAVRSPARFPVRPEHESTIDARPGMPVLPPSPQWLRGAYATAFNEQRCRLVAVPA